ncbi:MAG: reverse transcriptase domain-containing protein [Patescibacteria group bacterium]
MRLEHIALDFNGSAASFTERLVPIKGKLRKILDPNNEVRAIQAGFESALWDMELIPKLVSASAFQKGSSVLKNVLRHRGNQYFFLTDLRGAYESLTTNKLISGLPEIWKSFEDSEEEVRNFINRYLCPKGSLAFGGPISPLLFNLYCEQTLDYWVRMSLPTDVFYSRYADDLTFSSGKRPLSRRFKKTILKFIRRAGFEIAAHKTQSLDIGKGSVLINGMRLLENGHLSLRKKDEAFFTSLVEKVVRGQSSEEERSAAYGFLGNVMPVIPYLRAGRRQKHLALMCFKLRRAKKGRRTEEDKKIDRDLRQYCRGWSEIYGERPGKLR